jgi:hypothetical protein
VNRRAQHPDRPRNPKYRAKCGQRARFRHLSDRMHQHAALTTLTGIKAPWPPSERDYVLCPSVREAFYRGRRHAFLAGQSDHEGWAMFRSSASLRRKPTASARRLQSIFRDSRLNPPTRSSPARHNPVGGTAEPFSR